VSVIVIGGGPHPQAVVKPSENGFDIVDGDTVLATSVYEDVAHKLLPLFHHGLDHCHKV